MGRLPMAVFWIGTICCFQGISNKFFGRGKLRSPTSEIPWDFGHLEMEMLRQNEVMKELMVNFLAACPLTECGSNSFNVDSLWQDLPYQALQNCKRYNCLF